MSSRIFNGPPIFLPTNELVRASQTETVVKPTSVTVTGGTTVGNVFHTDGDDFLDPDKIGGTTTTFGDSIKPVTSSTPQNQVINVDPFGSNPDSVDILTNTSSILDGILNGPVTFPTGNFSPVIVDPLQWRNPNGVSIFSGVNNALVGLFQGNIPGIITPTPLATTDTLAVPVTQQPLPVSQINTFGSLALAQGNALNSFAPVTQKAVANDNASPRPLTNNLTVAFDLPNTGAPLSTSSVLSQIQQTFLALITQLSQLSQFIQRSA